MRVRKGWHKYHPNRVRNKDGSLNIVAEQRIMKKGVKT